MAKLLGLARASQHMTTEKGESEQEVPVSEDLYKNLKRFVVYAEAKAIVVNVPDKKPFGAWRQLHAKHDPRNDATAQQGLISYCIRGVGNAQESMR